MTTSSSLCRVEVLVYYDPGVDDLILTALKLLSGKIEVGMIFVEENSGSKWKMAGFANVDPPTLDETIEHVVFEKVNKPMSLKPGMILVDRKP